MNPSPERARHYLKKINEGKHLNAFLSVFKDRARSNTSREGKLSGMTIAVKDIIAMKGERLTCGSKFLENFVSLYDATVVERLEREGALIIGKTNMDEFAMGSSNENSAYGPVLNPVDITRVPGGSSGGSAVAVAAQMCDVALGTDTGGSIRQPAAFCGVVGVKPTYGRVSRYGLVAFASSLDQIGPFSRTVKESAQVLETIAGYDERDSTSSTSLVGNYVEACSRGVKGLRVGVPKEFFGEGLNEEIRTAVEKSIDTLRKGGALIEEVSLPMTPHTIAVYYIIATAEASSNLARFDGIRYGRRAKNATTLVETYTRSRDEGFGAEVKRRIMLGTYVLSSGYYDAYYKKAQQVRRLLKEDFTKAFAKCDVLISPTTPTTAFKLGEKVSDPLSMYLNDVYAAGANLAGICAMSVPAGRDSSGLPIGVQIMAGEFCEEKMFAAGEFLFNVTK